MGCAISNIVFQPPSFPSTIKKSDIIMLTTRKGNSIAAFYVDEGAATTIVVSHGNAEDLGMIHKWAFDFARQLKVNVIAYDYEGYGHSQGTPSEQGCYEDIDAVLDYLIDERGASYDRIVLFGRSIGSGPTCYACERLSKAGTPPAGVILQAPLLSTLRIALDVRFTLPCDMFDNISRVRHFRAPTLVIHGTRDEIVPFWHGERLFLSIDPAFRARPLWALQAQHNNIEVVLRADGAFYDGISDFLEENCSGAGRRQRNGGFTINAVRAKRGAAAGEEHAPARSFYGAIGTAAGGEGTSLLSHRGWL